MDRTCNNRFFGSAPTANYGARTSGAGALVELSTRSRTNVFHGPAFEFLRNTALNANNFFINARSLNFARAGGRRGSLVRRSGGDSEKR